MLFLVIPGLNLQLNSIKFEIIHSHLALEPRRAGAGSSGRVTVGVVLAGADLCAVPAEGVDGAGAVTVVARVARFADAGAGPGVAAVIR